MSLRTLMIGCALCCGLVPLAPRSGFAQPVVGQSIQQDGHHLRIELNRVNAEITALKGGGRSVRNDYLLRDKLAEAESLARRLTEAEKRERTPPVAAPTEIPGSALVPPVATPHDSAVELEAKADLLSDQARRFRAEADTLAHTAEQIRARQALRRRAGAWDRDPLAGFENSKRNFAVTGKANLTAGDSGSRETSHAGSGKNVAIDSPMSGPTNVASTPGGTRGPVLGQGPPTEVSNGSPVTASAPSASHPLAAPTVSTTDSGSKALQQRPLLDPASLASVRSNLSQSGSLSDPEAIEAAALALRKHAQALEERARRLRTGAAQE